MLFPGISQFGFARVPFVRHSSGAVKVTISPLAAASTRELLWGLRAVSSEVSRWRSVAATIPDITLRHDALRAIDHKRANIDGAALFWTLPRRRNFELLRVLIAYEVLADFLDCTNERGAHAGIANGVCLHRALRDALNPDASVGNYYRRNPWKQDGGYLRLLITTCQQACVLLPSFEVTRTLIDRAAILTKVLALNHEPDPLARDKALSEWAEAQFDECDLTWFEWCGGCSAWLTILALLALAADTERTTFEARAVYEVYLPWVSLVGTMLDSYVDLAEDATENAHSYIAHYSDLQLATDRVIEVVSRALQGIADLPNASRHAVIVHCMVAMYLSKDSARTSEMRASSNRITRVNGNVGHVFVRVLRLWRVLYQQQSA